MLSFSFCDSHHKTAAVRLLSEKKKKPKKTSKLFLQILTINVKTIKAIQNLEMPCFILQYLSSSINTISDQLLAYYSTQVYDHLSGQILIKQWQYLRVGMKQVFFFFVTFCCLSQRLLSDSNTIWKLSFVAEKLISEIKKELSQLSAWIWSWEGNTMALDSLWPWTVIEKTVENIIFL